MYCASVQYGRQPCCSSSKNDSFFFSDIGVTTYSTFAFARILKSASLTKDSEVGIPDCLSPKDPEKGAKSQKWTEGNPRPGSVPRQENASECGRASDDRCRRQRKKHRFPSKEGAYGRDQFDVSESHCFARNCHSSKGSGDCLEFV